jgi:bifunctional DNA-binding transcriptional regulator/antitoxin component of YhaV-PrlF toxin-antitoxin module
LSETILTVGNKGEIYTNSTLRKRLGIKKRGKVKAKVSEGKLIIEPMPSLEELINAPVVKIGIREAERLSEETQKEAGAYD